ILVSCLRGRDRGERAHARTGRGPVRAGDRDLRLPAEDHAARGGWNRAGGGGSSVAALGKPLTYFRSSPRKRDPEQSILDSRFRGNERTQTLRLILVVRQYRQRLHAD